MSSTDLSGNPPMIFPPPAPPPAPLSINDLLNAHEVIVQKEADDRLKINAFVDPGVDEIKPALYQWAKSGFPGLYSIRNLSLVPPTMCSDGEIRPLLRYFEYVYGKPMNESLVSLTSKVQGMVFTFSHDGSTNITLHVSRA